MRAFAGLSRPWKRTGLLDADGGARRYQSRRKHAARRRQRLRRFGSCCQREARAKFSPMSRGNQVRLQRKEEELPRKSVEPIIVFCLLQSGLPEIQGKRSI